jgi:hypothetical protein
MEEQHNSLVWETQDRTKIAIENLENDHLINIYFFLNRQRDFRRSRTKRFMPKILEEIGYRNLFDEVRHYVLVFRR